MPRSARRGGRRASGRCAHRLVDRQQPGIVRQQKRAGLRLDRHTNIFPDLHADRTVGEGPLEASDRALGESRALEAASIERRRPRQRAATIATDLERGTELVLEVEWFAAARRAHDNVQPVPVRLLEGGHEVLGVAVDVNVGVDPREIVALHRAPGTSKRPGRDQSQHVSSRQHHVTSFLPYCCALRGATDNRVVPSSQDSRRIEITLRAVRVFCRRSRPARSSLTVPCDCITCPFVRIASPFFVSQSRGANERDFGPYSRHAGHAIFVETMDSDGLGGRRDA